MNIPNNTAVTLNVVSWEIGYNKGRYGARVKWKFVSDEFSFFTGWVQGLTDLKRKYQELETPSHKQ